MLGIIDADVFNHWSARGSDTPEEAVEMLHTILENAMAGSFADTFKVAVKGKGNYRKDVFNDYKANRKALDPEVKARLIATHKVLINEYDAVPADNMEADDLVRIWAEEAKSAGEDFVVIAEDKDLNCIAGPHYNPKKDLHFFIDEDAADELMHIQYLTGDGVDNIKGLWKIGPVKAKKILDVVQPEDRLFAVMSAWEEKHPEDWYERLEVCGSLIFILPDYETSFKDILRNAYKERYMDGQG